MTKYQEFLNKCNVLSEDLFNDIVNSLPEYDTADVDFYDIVYDCLDSQDEISRCIIDSLLNEWNYVYVEEVDFENKTMVLQDVDTLEDLEDIKNKFSKWTISNYEDLKKAVLESEEEDRKDREYFEKRHLIDSIIEDVSLDELKEIVKKYVKQG